MTPRSALADGALLDAVRGLNWPARRVAPACPPGVHRSRVRGAAPEFSEYRAFRQGDDPRRLDWKLLARTDRVFLRLADDRAVFGTMLVVDASASMDFPDADETKWQCAVQLAVALAQVAQQSGDPVGLIVAGRDVVVPPRTRRGIVADIANALSGYPDGPGPLHRAITARPLPTRLVLISDFLDDDPDVLRAATAHQAKGGEVVALDVIAQEELEPQMAPCTARDPENRKVARMFSRAAVPDYQRQFTEWRAATAGRWRVAGMRWIEVVTDEPVSRAVRRIVSPT